jgi:hypothetical protein
VRSTRCSSLHSQSRRARSEGKKRNAGPLITVVGNRGGRCSSKSGLRDAASTAACVALWWLSLHCVNRTQAAADHEGLRRWSGDKYSSVARVSGAVPTSSENGLNVGRQRMEPCT